jgi:hypothetical protein
MKTKNKKKKKEREKQEEDEENTSENNDIEWSSHILLRKHNFKKRQKLKKTLGLGMHFQN